MVSMRCRGNAVGVGVALWRRGTVSRRSPPPAGSPIPASSDYAIHATICRGDTRCRRWRCASMATRVNSPPPARSPIPTSSCGGRRLMPDFTRYTVVAEDTLSALAARFYGDASYIRLSPPSMASPILASTSGRYWSYSSGVATGFGLGSWTATRTIPALPVPDLRGWNPGQRLLPDDYRTSHRLYLRRRRDQDFRTFRLSGHPRYLTAGKADHHRDARRRARAQSSFVGPYGTGRHSSQLPWIGRTRYDGRAVAGFRWVASVRSKVLRPLRVGEQRGP